RDLAQDARYVAERTRSAQDYYPSPRNRGLRSGLRDHDAGRVRQDKTGVADLIDAQCARIYGRAQP
ncbi:hypothetical protein ABTK02_22335, partial [Acinetobacter baumannii]